MFGCYMLMNCPRHIHPSVAAHDRPPLPHSSPPGSTFHHRAASPLQPGCWRPLTQPGNLPEHHQMVGVHRHQMCKTKSAMATAAPSMARSSVKDSLLDLPLLTFAEFVTASANFSNAHRLAPSSSNSLCAPRPPGRRLLLCAAVRPGRGLTVLGHCHQTATARL